MFEPVSTELYPKKSSGKSRVRFYAIVYDLHASVELRSAP